jgi:hypothetical protein
MSTTDTATRQALKQRPDVPDDDIDDLIAIAAELQDRDRAQADRASLSEVEAVAGELDIEPRYVEEALGELQRRREADAAAARERTATLRKAGLGAAGLVGCLLLLVGLSAATAVPSLRSTDTELQFATSQLDVVIDRQAALAPQLVALAGGRAADLDEAVAALQAADSVPERLAASDALGRRMAETLSALPPTDDASTQLRLNLQHEITGTTNRVATERQRYEAAKVAHDRARQGLRAGLATSLGLAD